MKRFENIFRTLCLLLALAATDVSALARNKSLARMDSIEVGLLTCSPHNEVYSLYGHTALHIHDLVTGSHIVFNYGVFDFNKPHFVWRFVMGQTDYRLEATTNLKSWCDYYRKWGSSVQEQILNLTPTEKLRLQYALAENLNNPEYRYNFFYDNCSTRPRDMIERCVEGTITYAERDGFEDATYRELTHLCTKGHPWAEFGNDLLLGLNADRKTTQRERQFLPEFLQWDFDHATIDGPKGQRPLVLRTVVHVPQGVQTPEKEFPLPPFACTLLFIIISVAILVYEMRYHKILVWWDAVLMLLTGLAGCILFLMIFSEHPATSLNVQLLLFNPLALYFIPYVLKRRKTKWFVVWSVLLILFFASYIFQHYHEELLIVALCLQLRCLIHKDDK